MNNLKIFEKEEFGQIRTILDENNEPWFVAKDIAEILGYKQTANMVKILDDRDYKEINPQNVANTGFIQNGITLEPNENIKRMLVINESALYQAIFGSTLEKAKKFKRWVTSEVLPAIRKHGAYVSESLQDMYKDDPMGMALYLAENLLKLKNDYTQLDLENQGLRFENKIQKQINQELQAKTDYTDAILNHNSTVTVTCIAKDYGMSANQFNALLNKLGIQYKESGQWFLYSKYQSEGYTQSKTYYVPNTDVVNISTKWTQKGRLFIYNTLKEIGILPTIERIESEEKHEDEVFEM